MRFLIKPEDTLRENAGLRYPADRNRAVEVLTQSQRGFCAYSERCLKPLDSIDLEHFDPRLKGTEADGIGNWHAVIHWMNAHKARKIDRFEPLPDLSQWQFATRVRYERGFFVCDDEDQETKNLMEFLGVNKPEVYEERSKHVGRLRKMMDLLGADGLCETLMESPDELSFPSAMEAELQLPVSKLIEATTSPRN